MSLPLQYQTIIRQSAWTSMAEKIVAADDVAWLPWLLHQGSLTSALMEFSSERFRVRVLSQHWARPLARESRLLGVDYHLAARIREVELLCNEEVVVFARSVIPLALFRQEPHTFQGMGSQPLGHLLFKDGRARIRKREISSLATKDGSTIYGRATPYQYHGGEILVSEYFVNPVLIR
jgi:chorismate--pyruvate lyase